MHRRRNSSTMRPCKLFMASGPVGLPEYSGLHHRVNAPFGNGKLSMAVDRSRISLGKRLRTCPSFRCLGIMPNWEDYPVWLRELVRGEMRIHYPSPLYEDLFRSLGKQVFPSNYYRFMGHKIRQTALFQLLGISHPRTRLYYGKNCRRRILRDFALPFIAKAPVGSSGGAGVWMIEDEPQLKGYLQRYNPAYIQEYLPLERDLRVVLISKKVAHAYWRLHAPGEFRNNVSRGARISFAGIPREALDFAVDVAERCNFDEVGLDICECAGCYYVLEANMVFGLQGFRQGGLDLYEILTQWDRQGLL